MAGKALITGGPGYIVGTLIDRLLPRGWSVHTAVRFLEKSETRMPALQADAAWAEANEGYNPVAHVAGVSRFVQL